MIEQIRKRDGRTEVFDSGKITHAIMKAMEQEGEVNISAAMRIANKIQSCIGDELVDVERIQDMVEDGLMDSQCRKTAKAYIKYREKRNQKRQKNSELNKKIEDILLCNNVQNQNANVDEHSFGGRKFESANVLHKSIALDAFIRPEVAQAHKESRIYIHDLSEYDIGDHNCLFVDMQRLLNQGFTTRNGDVRPANSFATACQLIAVIFQIQSQVQFGGVASCHLDYDLAPFVKKSFYKHYIDGCRYLIHLPEYTLSVIYDYLKKNQLSIEDDYFKRNDPAYRYAIELLEREGKQAAESLYHNLNTLESRAGSQIPFTSINFGTDTSVEGRMVSRWLMNASIAGIGKYHLTPIFPISIFKYKKGVNAKEGDPNYDLKKLAIKSLSQRIYPNIVNCDFSQNVEEPGNPDTEMATMGCVHGREIVFYQIDGITYCGPIEAMWDKLSSQNVVKVSGFSEYIELDNVRIYDTANGFVGLTCAIRNRADTWGRMHLENGASLIFTPDHPMMTDRGLVRADELRVRDKIQVNNTCHYKDILNGFIYKEMGSGCNSTVEFSAVKSIEWSKADNEYCYDVTTESGYFEVSGIRSHNCRTMLGFDRNGLGYSKVGRGNVCPTTINLPKIGIRHGICLGERERADIDGFWQELDEVLHLTELSLVDRFYHICNQSVKSATFMYGNGTVADHEKAALKGIYESMKHGTLAVGYIGIAEMCQAMFGMDHSEDDEVWHFALSVVEHISDFCKQVSEKHNLNFSCYASPAENLCYTYAKALRNEFGVIPNITDRDYITNSHHIPVWKEISIYRKLELEAPFCKYPTGGCITYIELESSIMQNQKAVEDIIDYAMGLDVPYLAFNFPIDTCLKCGYQGDIEYNCPKCGNTEIQRLRRVTGYLTTDYRNFNEGKIKECLDRVKHSKYTDFAGSGS